MSRWFRYYDEALNDPKVQRLSGDVFKVWVNFLCLASKGDGLVMRSDVTFGLRFTDEKDANFFIEKLIEANLIEDRGDVLAPHNWRKRQYKSDSSTKRVKQFRKRRRNVSETPPDTEQSRDRTEQKAHASGKVEFEEFWKNYPKREGSNRKSPAEKAFQKAVREGAEPTFVISAAKRFAEREATNVGTRFIPMAVTWLNQKGWEEFEPDPGALEKLRSLVPMMRARGYELHEETVSWRKVEAA